MKPINYYVQHPSIDKIVEHYGARLEKLTQWQKFEVIGYLGLWASEVMAADDDGEIEWSNLPIDAEPDDEVALILGFCEAMNPQHIKDFIMAIADCIEVPSETAYYPLAPFLRMQFSIFRGGSDGETINDWSLGGIVDRGFFVCRIPQDYRLGTNR